MGIATWCVCRDGTPIINIVSGREKVEKQLKADMNVEDYVQINKRHGVTCHDDIWNNVIRKSKPPLREYKKTLGQRIFEWFTEVVE